MINADLSPLANHLWQSTLCAMAVWLLTLALKNNRASVRYSLWMAASVKFLIPFALLVGLGSQLGWRTSPAIPQRQFPIVINQIARPFVSSAPRPRLREQPPAPTRFPESLLFGVWFCGFAAGVICWARWWHSIRRARRTATPLNLHLPIPVLSLRARLEPGVFGIWRPVLLLSASSVCSINRILSSRTFAGASAGIAPSAAFASMS